MLAIVVNAYKCSAVVVHDCLLLQAALAADNTALSAEVVRGAEAVPPMTHRAAACCSGRMECALIACRVCVCVCVGFGCGAVSLQSRLNYEVAKLRSQLVTLRCRKCQLCDRCSGGGV